MKLFFGFLFTLSSVFAQSASFPSAVVTDSQLMVGKNQVQSTLLAAAAATDTVMAVTNSTGFVANSLASIDSEIIAICGVSGNLLQIGYNGSCTSTNGRGFDGTSAASHAAGATISLFIDAWHHNALRVEMEAIETALGANLANIPGSPSGGAVPISKGGTGATTQSAALTAILGSSVVLIANGGTGATTQGAALTAILGASAVPIANGGTGATTQGAAFTAILGSSVVPLANGGTGVTSAQGNGSKVQLSTGTTTTNNCVKFDANGNTVDSGGTCGGGGGGVTLPNPSLSLQTLRYKANTGTAINANLTANLEWAPQAVFVSTPYNWTGQQPFTSLSIGSNTITLTPCPKGVQGAATWTQLYILGGTGAAEVVPVTGGTCAGDGIASGTVIVTCANTHSGAWEIVSATSGIQEAINDAGQNNSVFVPAGTYNIYGTITIPASFTGFGLFGAGMNQTFINPQLGNVTALDWKGTTYLDVHDFQISAPGGATSGTLVNFEQLGGGRVYGIEAGGGYNGIYFGCPVNVFISHIIAENQTNRGVWFSATSGHSCSGFFSDVEASPLSTAESACYFDSVATGNWTGPTFWNLQCGPAVHGMWMNPAANSSMNEGQCYECAIIGTSYGLLVTTSNPANSSENNWKFLGSYYIAATGVNGIALSLDPGVHNFVFSNVDFNNNDTGQAVVLIEGSSHVYFDSCRFEGKGLALEILDASGPVTTGWIQVRNSHFGNAFGNGDGVDPVNAITIAGGSHNVIVQANEIYATSGILSYTATGTGNLFRGNHIVASAGGYPGKPTCDATIKGSDWYTESAGGVKDLYESCRKDAANAMAWQTMIP